MNHMIDAHPMDGVRYTKPVRAADDIHFLTIEEQERFLNAARSTHKFLSVRAYFRNRTEDRRNDWLDLGCD